MRKKQKKEIAQDMAAFLKQYNFRPNEILGQNFLMDELALEKIAEAGNLSKKDQVLEIGPGIGNLTARLADAAGFVLAVEKDRRYFPILKDVLGESLQSHSRTPKSKSNVMLVFGDIMSYNFQKILEPGYKVVANIPYYITGKIIEMLLAAGKKPSKIILLVQREVAERACAKSGDMSVLAISIQLYADARIAGYVGKESFYPEPKVDSAILELDILKKPRIDVDEKKFFKIVKSCFAGKRKQIKNTLKNNLRASQQVIDDIAKQGVISLEMRPQELTLEQWLYLYKILE